MGWDEVKKINSDMKVPLDVYQYLNDYRLWGEDSYVYQDKSKLHKLYETTVVSMNDMELSGEALEYLTTANKHIGKALGSVYGIQRKDTLSTLSAMSAVANSSTAMQAVFNKGEMMTYILNSTNCMLLKNTGLPGANGYQCYGKFILIGSTYQYDCVDSCIPDYRSQILSNHSKVIDTSKFGKIFVKIGVQGVPLNTVYTMLDDANGGNLCVVYKL